MYSYDMISRYGIINLTKETSRAEEYKEKVLIKTPTVEQTVNNLSGGNQQKVVFAKSMLIQPKILLLDDPTVGIDVEAKAAIGQLIRTIADHNNAVLLISSEMEELESLCRVCLAVCDIVFVACGGS